MRPELTQAIRLLRSNNPDSVGQAIGLLQNTVYSFSMKVCGHREDAEDTMQEVLYRSLRHLARIEEPRALAVWLYTVTRNRCWRMRRTAAREAKQLSLDELMPDEAEIARLLRDPRQDPRAMCCAVNSTICYARRCCAFRRSCASCLCFTTWKTWARKRWRRSLTSSRALCACACIAPG